MKHGTSTNRDHFIVIVPAKELIIIKSKPRFNAPIPNKMKAAIFIPFRLTCVERIVTADAIRISIARFGRASL